MKTLLALLFLLNILGLPVTGFSEVTSTVRTADHVTSGTAQALLLPLAESVPVLSVVSYDWGPPSIADPEAFRIAVLKSTRVHFAVWGDGTVLWSDNLVDGSGMLHLGSLGTGEFDQFRSAWLSSLRSTSEDVLHRGFMLPHSPYTVLKFHEGDVDLTMLSYHEMAETDNPGVLATGRGIGPVPASASNRAAAVSELPASIQEFRRVWGEIGQLVRSNVPEVPDFSFSGHVGIDDGAIYYLGE